MKEIQINVPNQVVISLIPIIILISYLQYKVKLNQSVNYGHWQTQNNHGVKNVRASSRKSCY